MTYLDRRRDDLTRQIVTVAQRHQKTLGPYHAARFLCANSVPIKVALRVIVGRNQSGSEGCIRTK
jgi:hypothetical protein